MNIPQSSFLANQTFGENLVEFVWQFPIKKGIKNQIIFRSCKTGTPHTHLEEGLIGEDGEYLETSYSTSAILTTKNLSSEELLKLNEEVEEYLNTKS